MSHYDMPNGSTPAPSGDIPLDPLLMRKLPLLR